MNVAAPPFRFLRRPTKLVAEAAIEAASLTPVTAPLGYVVQCRDRHLSAWTGYLECGSDSKMTFL